MAKKVINGLTYNTETATALLKYGPGYTGHDFRSWETVLYRTVNGRYFTVSDGGPLSEFGTHGNGPSHNESWPSTDVFEVIEEEKAKSIIEEYGDHKDYVEAFGEPEVA